MNEYMADRWLTRMLDRIGRPNGNGCQEWTGCILKAPHGRKGMGGYGRLTVPAAVRRALGLKRYEYTHRAIFALHNGPIADGMTVDHICFNRACCNPAHLQLLTPSQNSAKKKPREYELTPDEAVRLFRAGTASALDLSARVGVSRSTIYYWARNSSDLNEKAPAPDTSTGPTTNPEGSVTDGSAKPNVPETSTTKDTGGK